MDSHGWTLNLPDQDTGALLGIGLGLAAALYTLSVVVRWYRLSHVPGPLLNGITSLNSFWWLKTSKFDVFVINLQKKYGKIVRLSPTSVMIDDPNEYGRINGARSAYIRGGWYQSMTFNPWGGNILNEMDPTAHGKRKAKLVHAFSGQSLQNIEQKLGKQIAILKDVLKTRISKASIDGQGRSAVLDLSRILYFFQVDLIMDVGVGETWGTLTDDKDHYNYKRDCEEAFSVAHSVAVVPFLRNVMFSNAFLRLFGPNVEKGWLGAVHDAVKRNMSDHDMAKVEDESSIFNAWLKQGHSRTEAEFDLTLLMPAGTDTSLSTVRGTLLYLTMSPSIYSRLKQEIVDAIKQGRISSPVMDSEAKAMPYLRAVVNEGMRITPPVTAGFGKAVPPGGDVVCGKFLPAGTEVHLNTVGLMRNKEVFGDDVDVFRPERFIDCDDATRARQEKVVDLNFGTGRWMCLGKKLALMEIYKIFVELLRTFDFQVVDPEKPWHRTATSTWFITDLNVVVTYNPIG